MSSRGVARPVDLDAPLERAQLGHTLRDDCFVDTIVTQENRTPSEPAPQMSLRPPNASSGTDLEVVGELGAGGMGVVLLASQRSLGREVAVKVLRRPSPEYAAIFEEEARLTGGLEHPGIIPVHALGSDEAGWPALIMKRVEGLTWSELLSMPQSPAWERLAPGGDRLEANVRILQQVCNAVAFAHRKGVIHRDLKPANVLVGEYGEIYVADWGIAVRRSAPPVATLCGTPAYLAPEMARKDPTQLSERTDVFLLGATLYEVLAGRPPWQADTLAEIVAQAVRGTPPPLPEPHLSSELGAICATAMARVPEHRFPGPLQLRDALEVALQHRGSVAISDATSQRLSALSSGFEHRAPMAALAPLISECRFGFSQALREWPQNLKAQSGLRRSFELAIELELREGRAASARALATELGTLAPELEARLIAQEASEAADRARGLELEALVREQDPQVARGPRLLFAVLLASLILASGASRRFAPDWWARPEALFLASVTFLLCFVVLMLVFRKVVLTTVLNQRIAGYMSLVLLSQVMNRAHAWSQGLAAPDTLVRELGLIGLVAMSGTFAFHWSFLSGAAVAFAGAVVFTLYPHLAVRGFSLVTFLAVVVTVAFWRTWRVTGERR